MAARKVKREHDQLTRDKIQTTQIVKRLTNHVLGKVDMTPSQVSAGLGLLKKTLPDLQSQTNAEGTGPQEYVFTGVPRAGDG